MYIYIRVISRERALTPVSSTVVPKKHKIVPALMDRLYVNTIRHMLSVFASFCELISVEYILINKTNVCVLIFGDLIA
jgi:hypothetical protein